MLQTLKNIRYFEGMYDWAVGTKKWYMEVFG
jgi:hypothetical protein